MTCVCCAASTPTRPTGRSSPSRHCFHVCVADRPRKGVRQVRGYPWISIRPGLPRPGWTARLRHEGQLEAIVQSALTTLITEICGSVDVAMEVSGAQPGGMRLTFEVSSLVGAMWLQFALAVDGNRRYRSCP